MEQNKLQDLLSVEWIAFNTQKIKNTALVWRYPSDPQSTGLFQKGEDFLLSHSYAIADTPAFQNIEFDFNQSKLLVAERYGGSGIGSNGGGGRCGNTDAFQLKGIGANCLVGEEADHLHSYGGLDACAAIVETINSYVFGKILPLGTVKVHGLILTGKDTGFDIAKNQKCWGVIMVRDKCLRPAHLVRIVSFKPLSNHKLKKMNDVARMRRMYKQLSASFTKHNEFIVMLGQFLRNQANQFGFARAARILNGVLSHSNCTLDGRWIDLNSCSFIDSGINYSIKSQFYSEHRLPLEYALELLHNYSKYNKVTLAPEPLINYYREQFLAYFSHHIGFTLGCDSAQLPQQTSLEWHAVVDSFNHVIHANTNATNTRARVNPKDPVFALIRGLYLSLVSPLAAASDYHLAGVATEPEQQALSKNFFLAMKNIYFQTVSNVSAVSFFQFVTTCFMSAMKRSYLSSIYYLPLLERNVRDFCDNSSPDDIWNFIDSYCNAANWIYEYQPDQIDILKTSSIAVQLTFSPYQYSLVDSLRNVIFFNSFDSLAAILSEEYSDQLWLGGYNLFHYIDGLRGVLPIMESKKNVLMEVVKV